MNIRAISTLHPEFLCHSDHLGIVFDIDLQTFFDSKYSDVSTLSPRLLTSGNLKSVFSYIKYVSAQIKQRKLVEKVQVLFDKTTSPSSAFTVTDAKTLNKIDNHLKDIMLAGKRHCSGRKQQQQFWSPSQRTIARTFSYWKQKSIMEAKECFNWNHLDHLRRHTLITDLDHSIIDPVILTEKKRITRSQWKVVKRRVKK
jgi:hypothetical protein